MYVYEAKNSSNSLHALFIIIFSTCYSTTYNGFGIALHSINNITQRHTIPCFTFISLNITECIDVYIVYRDYFGIEDGQTNICGMIGISQTPVQVWYLIMI